MKTLTDYWLETELYNCGIERDLLIRYGGCQVHYVSFYPSPGKRLFSKVSGGGF
jgi:hypothetical protein